MYGAEKIYVNNNGSINIDGIRSSDNIYATKNIEAIGSMLCKSISANGVAGVNVYNGTTLIASMKQTGAIAGTSLAISKALHYNLYAQLITVAILLILVI